MARKIGSRYTAHQILGRGSAGTVWLGEGPDGPVAIKLLREDLAADQELVGRFVQERTALLSLDDPHIVDVRDLVVDGTDLALVMRLVRGCDLRSRLERDRRLAPETAVAIAADVADALAAAHGAGVIHRDVKPENILLDAAAPPGPGDAPPALLTDFGIARLVDAPRRTRATRIIGTPDYLAPEIIEGLPPRASVDIYALATVLYELLTGFTPFGGGHPGAVLRRHVTETVTRVPGVPEPLWKTLAQCLAKAPASRLTAGELGERLRALLPGLAGLPPLDIPVPDEARSEADGPEAAVAPPEDGQPEHRPPAPAARARRGAVPLVPGSAPDSSRETHTSIKLPSADQLAAYPRRQRGGSADRPSGGGARHRADADAVLRRRRLKLAAVAGAALVAAGLGGWVLASGGGDAKATTRRDQPPGDASSTGAGASPQGGIDAPADRPSSSDWSAFTAAPRPWVPLTGGPRALVISGTSYVFARGTDGCVWYVTRDARTGRYGTWQRLTGIRVAGDPAVVSAQPGQLDLFALGTDGLLYGRTMSGGAWGGWYQLDRRTRFDAAPAAASSAPGRLDLVGVAGGQLVTASYVNGSWTAWSAIPTSGASVTASGGIQAAPALISGARGTLDAFAVRASDGAVLRLRYVGGAWQPVRVVAPGRLVAAGRPEAVAAGGRIHVIVPTRRGGLAEAVDASAGTGAEWSVLPLPSPSAAGAAPGADVFDGAHPELWTRTASGGLSRSVLR